MSEATKWLGDATRVQTELENLGMDMDELAKMLVGQDVGGFINRQQVPGLLGYGDDYTVFRCPYDHNSNDDGTWIGLMRMPRIEKPDTWTPVTDGFIRRLATLAETERILDQLMAGTIKAMAGYSDVLVLGTRVECQTNPGYSSPIRARYDQRACCWSYSTDSLAAQDTPVYQVLVSATNRRADHNNSLHVSQTYACSSGGDTFDCKFRNHYGCVSVKLTPRTYATFHRVKGGPPYETVDRQ